MKILHFVSLLSAADAIEFKQVAVSKLGIFNYEYNDKGGSATFENSTFYGSCEFTGSVAGIQFQLFLKAKRHFGQKLLLIMPLFDEYIDMYRRLYTRNRFVMRAEMECSDKAKKPLNHDMDKWLRMSENLTMTPGDMRNIQYTVEMPDPLFGGYVEINQTEYDYGYYRYTRYGQVTFCHWEKLTYPTFTSAIEPLYRNRFFSKIPGGDLIKKDLRMTYTSEALPPGPDYMICE